MPLLLQVNNVPLFAQIPKQHFPTFFLSTIQINKWMKEQINKKIRTTKQKQKQNNGHLGGSLQFELSLSLCAFEFECGSIWLSVRNRTYPLKIVRCSNISVVQCNSWFLKGEQKGIQTQWGEVLLPQLTQGEEECHWNCNCNWNCRIENAIPKRICEQLKSADRPMHKCTHA